LLHKIQSQELGLIISQLFWSFKILQYIGMICKMLILKFPYFQDTIFYKN